MLMCIYNTFLKFFTLKMLKASLFSDKAYEPDKRGDATPQASLREPPQPSAAFSRKNHPPGHEGRGSLLSGFLRKPEIHRAS